MAEMSHMGRDIMRDANTQAKFQVHHAHAAQVSGHWGMLDAVHNIMHMLRKCLGIGGCWMQSTTLKNVCQLTSRNSHSIRGLFWACSTRLLRLRKLSSIQVFS